MYVGKWRREIREVNEKGIRKEGVYLIKELQEIKEAWTVAKEKTFSLSEQYN